MNFKDEYSYYYDHLGSEGSDDSVAEEACVQIIKQIIKNPVKIPEEDKDKVFRQIIDAKKRQVEEMQKKYNGLGERESKKRKID